MKIEWNELTAMERDAIVDRVVFEREQQYHLMKLGLYYRPPANGYTDNPFEAARYSLEEAQSHATRSGEVKIIPCDPAKFTTDIAAAFTVVEKMKFNWTLTCNNGDCAGTKTESLGYRMIYTAPSMPMAGVLADTASEAICIAALMAKGHEVIL